VTLPRVTVVKVGGSLLSCGRLAEELPRWLRHDKDSPKHVVLVAGGGQLVETIRKRCETNEITDEKETHWQCVDAMSTTAAMLAQRLINMTVVSDYDRLKERLVKPGRTVFDCRSFLRHNEKRLTGTRLKESWDVTSDSIAGRLAIALRADAFVLLKSALPTSGSCREMSKTGFVDPFLERLAIELPPTRVVNLRDPSFPESETTA
jgi:aspartokinase-like uncharacterized kinase